MKKLLILVLMLCSLILVSCGGEKKSDNVADIKTPDVLPTPAPVEPETDAEKQENFAESLNGFNELDSSILDSLLPAQQPELPEVNLGGLTIPTSKMEVYATQGSEEVKMLDGYLWQVEDTVYAGMGMNMGEPVYQVAKLDLGDLSTELNKYLTSLKDMAAEAPQVKPSEAINQVLAEYGLTLDEILELLHFDAEDFDYKGNGKFVVKNESLARIIADLTTKVNPQAGVTQEVLMAMLEQLGIDLEISFTYANKHITNVAVSVKGDIAIPGENGQQSSMKIDVKLEAKLVYGETGLVGFGFGLDASVVGDKAAGQNVSAKLDLAVSVNGLTVEADVETGKAAGSVDATAALVLTNEKVVLALDAKMPDGTVAFKLSATEDKFSVFLDADVISKSYRDIYNEETGEYDEEVIETPIKLDVNAELTKSKVSASVKYNGKEMLNLSGTLENNWFKTLNVKVLAITSDWDETNNTVITNESKMTIKLTSVSVTVPTELTGMQGEALDLLPMILESIQNIGNEEYYPE